MRQNQAGAVQQELGQRFLSQPLQPGPQALTPMTPPSLRQADHPSWRPDDQRRGRGSWTAVGATVTPRSLRVGSNKCLADGEGDPRATGLARRLMVGWRPTANTPGRGQG